uniref:Uncharacterized protein n=1 Tax=Aegilops tauschii subsp. strangulata TaxID=200361 RepID=A0A453PZX4_AEGTS
RNCTLVLFLKSCTFSMNFLDVRASLYMNKLPNVLHSTLHPMINRLPLHPSAANPTRNCHSFIQRERFCFPAE